MCDQGLRPRFFQGSPFTPVLGLVQLFSGSWPYCEPPKWMKQCLFAPSSYAMRSRGDLALFGFVVDGLGANPPKGQHWTNGLVKSIEAVNIFPI